MWLVVLFFFWWLVCWVGSLGIARRSRKSECRHETREDDWDVILTASLISSLCSSVNRLSGFASCPCPWDCVAAGAAVGCCVCLGPSGPPKSPGPGLPIPRCLEKDEALKGMAFVLTERSGILVPA
jgi:membrane-associated PAP2 superfamily phosphatase